MRPVWAASTVLAAKDWRAMYLSVGVWVGVAVVVIVTGGAVVELCKKEITRQKILTNMNHLRVKKTPTTINRLRF